MPAGIVFRLEDNVCFRAEKPTTFRIEPQINEEVLKRKTNARGDWHISFGKKDIPIGTVT